jgi:hypothetical protein
MGERMNVIDMFRHSGYSVSDHNNAMIAIVDAVSCGPVTYEKAKSIMEGIPAPLVQAMWENLPNICGAKLDGDAYVWVEYEPVKQQEKILPDRMTAGEVNMAMAAIGLKQGLGRPVTPSELGRMLGATGKNAGQSVNHWLCNHHKPSAMMTKLIRMLAEKTC